MARENVGPRMSHEAVNWAYDRPLGTGAALSSRKFVLVTIADHANEDGICWPSHGRLAKRIGLHRSSIKRLIDELDYNHHVLHQVKRPGTSTLLVLHLPKTLGATWESATAAHLFTPEGVAGCDTPDPVDNYVRVSQGATPHVLQGATPPRASDATPPRASDARRTVKNRKESPSTPTGPIEHVNVSGKCVYPLDEETQRNGLAHIREIREAQLATSGAGSKAERER